MADLPAILARTQPKPAGTQPMDVYIRLAQESELVAIALRRQAGDRGFTYLGRHATKDMTLQDILKEFPLAEQGGRQSRLLTRLEENKWL